MNQIMRLKVLEGRKAVDAYREDHCQLHSKPWHRGIPEEHTPLLNKLLAELNKQGFNSLGLTLGKILRLGLWKLIE